MQSSCGAFGRSFSGTVFSLISVEQERREPQLDTGAAQQPRGVSGCPHLPGAREGGAGHGAQAGATAPWRPEPRHCPGHGARPPGQRGRRAVQRPAAGESTPGPGELPELLPAFCRAASSSACSGSFKPGGFKAALDPAGRGGFQLTLG